MRYKFLLILFFLYSCTPVSNTKYIKTPLNSKGFAFIYSFEDFENKIINKRINSDDLIIGHNQLRRGVLLKITNPRNGKNIILKNSFKVDYPDFYKILITEAISKKLDLNKDFPFIDVQELKKNKSFVAKKAQIFDEEKQLQDTAPVQKVKISNIGETLIKKRVKDPEFVIILGNFYSKESAKLLIKRVKTESLTLKNKKISIKKKNKHNFEVFLGPYKTINKIKNDYIALKQINFDEVDVKLYE